MGLFGNRSKRHEDQSASSAVENGSRATNFRGVQVNIDPESCCEAAKAISGKRFLEANTPMLPLAECDANDCRCTYKRFGDRRTETRRAADEVFDLAAEYCQDEKRSNKSSGRRRDD